MRVELDELMVVLIKLQVASFLQLSLLLWSAGLSITKGVNSESVAGPVIN